MITAVALIVAGAFWCSHQVTTRRHPSAEAAGPGPGLRYYLDEDYVKDLYQQDEYPEPQRDVQDTIRRNTNAELEIKPGPARAVASAGADSERVTIYSLDEGPLKNFRRIMRALEDANGIVHVDLDHLTIGPNASVDRALASTHGPRAGRARSARLTELDQDTFVSITGRFEITDRSETTTTFSAPYGDTRRPSDDPPRVSVTCDTAKLRVGGVADGPFPARCIGKIRKWDPDTRQLVISPVLAIFL
ncbi:hypothetical protein [Thermomonospora umbrina]|nr:hypothetical protein [Thermomonospora umbrina]